MLRSSRPSFWTSFTILESPLDLQDLDVDLHSIVQEVLDGHWGWGKWFKKSLWVFLNFLAVRPGLLSFHLPALMSINFAFAMVSSDENGLVFVFLFWFCREIWDFKENLKQLVLLKLYWLPIFQNFENCIFFSILCWKIIA